MTIAMSRWTDQSKLPKWNRESAKQIVNEVNTLHKTNVKEETVRRYVCRRQIGCSPRWGGGRKSIVPHDIQTALDSAIITYIQLTNAEMKQQPNRLLITKKLNACLEKGGPKFAQGSKVYDRMMNRLGDKIEVNDHNSVVEQCRLEWTTWSNINVWFDTLKHFFC